jgi:hypothetical protein
MPIDNIAFHSQRGGIVSLHNFADTQILQLEVRDAGKYVVFGKVVITNGDGDNQNASARLTTFNGATEIDRADVRIGAHGHADSLAISLQATLTLPSPQGAPPANNIIDMRCATFSGSAREAALFAILVDDLNP